VSTYGPRERADEARGFLADAWWEANEGVDDLAARRYAEQVIPPGALLMTPEQAKSVLAVLRFPERWGWQDHEVALYTEVTGWLEGTA
jgi:hypothetical protein